MSTDPQFPPGDRLFALIASIPGSGTIDWCGPARALLDEIAAAPVTVPPADRAGLRELIADAVVPLLLDTLPKVIARSRGYEIADAVLALLFGPIPADTDTATWTAIRAIQLMNEAGRERDAASAEPHRLALSTALGLGTSAPWDAIRERAAELQAEVRSLSEASRIFLNQRQEMAEERYAWQERGDGAEERVRALEAGQAALSDTDRKFLAFALELAADEMASRGDEFGADDEAALEKLRRLADETPGPETQGEARPPHHTWEVESPRRDNWASLGATYDERDWARERYESAIGNAPARPFRLVRATTTYSVEAEHQPTAETPDAPRREPHPTEADLRHALAVAAKFHGQAATAPAVAQTEVVHACPPDGSGLTPCCGRTPFELPLGDRISSEAPVTCTSAPAVTLPGKEG